MRTKHAEIRAQQRCIPPVIHQWLDEFGEEAYDGHGGVKVFFSSRSIDRMKRQLGPHFVEFIARWLSRAYRVESSHDGTALTCGWRHRRVRRR